MSCQHPIVRPAQAHYSPTASSAVFLDILQDAHSPSRKELGGGRLYCTEGVSGGGKPAAIKGGEVLAASGTGAALEGEQVLRSLGAAATVAAKRGHSLARLQRLQLISQ